MNKIYLSALCLFILISCSDESSISNREQYEAVSNELHPGLKIQLRRSELTPILDEDLNHRFNRLSVDYLWKDSILVYPFKNKIHQVNVRTGSHKVTEIPEYEVRNDIIYNYLINEDSILTLQLMPPILMINNSEGKVIYKKTLPFFDFNVDNLWWKSMNMALNTGSFNYNIQLLRSLYYDRYKKQVFIPFLPVDYIFLDKVENSETIGVFDLEKEDWEYGIGAAQGLVKYRGVQNYTKIFDQNYFLVQGDTTFLSYPISHHVFLMDTYSGELIDELVASPVEVDPIPQPINKELLSSGDFVKMEEWRAGSPFYSDFAYHEAVGLYSRIYFHKKGVVDGFKGAYWEGRQTTLLIFDDNINLLSSE